VGKAMNDNLSKGIIFFTDNQLNLKIAHAVQEKFTNYCQRKNIPIVSSSLKKMGFGDKNIHFPSKKRGILTMFTQIMAALEHSHCDIVYFCEHDVLYHPSHFEYIPPTDDAYYYNTNVWKLWMEDRIAIRTKMAMQVSGLVGYRDLLLGHYQRRVAEILRRQKDILAQGGEIVNDAFSKHMGYEPGGHMYPRGVDEYPMLPWESEWPIIDIRHGANFTKSKRRPEEFHDQKWTEGWTESTEIPGWGNVNDIIKRLT
jgi:hypothetical protein